MEQTEEKEHKEPEEGHPEHGRALFEWVIPEYAKYQRSRLWYVCAFAAAALLLLFSFRSGNFLFAVIIVMFAIIMFLNSIGEPHQVRFALTERGIVWGNRYHPYIDARGFWIVYQDPKVRNLYIEFKSIAKPRLQIPLNDQNPVALREFLKKVIREDATRLDEPVSDFLGRILKI